MGLNCIDLLTHRFFSIAVLEKFFEISYNLKKFIDEPYSLEMLKQLRKNYVMDS